MTPNLDSFESCIKYLASRGFRPQLSSFWDMPLGLQMYEIAVHHDRRYLFESDNLQDCVRRATEWALTIPACTMKPQSIIAAEWDEERRCRAIRRLIKRNEVRQAKDWKWADELKREIVELGFQIKDTKGRTALLDGVRVVAMIKHSYEHEWSL